MTADSDLLLIEVVDLVILVVLFAFIVLLCCVYRKQPCCRRAVRRFKHKCRRCCRKDHHSERSGLSDHEDVELHTRNHNTIKAQYSQAQQLEASKPILMYGTTKGGDQQEYTNSENDTASNSSMGTNKKSTTKKGVHFVSDEVAEDNTNLT